jgi:hypothetical protein
MEPKELSHSQSKSQIQQFLGSRRQCRHGHGGWQQLGLLMASSVPETRIAALNAIHNPGLEEETLRIRCGKQTGVLNRVLLSGKRNSSVVFGGGQP